VFALKVTIFTPIFIVSGKKAVRFKSILIIKFGQNFREKRSIVVVSCHYCHVQDSSMGFVKSR